MILSESIEIEHSLLNYAPVPFDSKELDKKQVIWINFISQKGLNFKIFSKKELSYHLTALQSLKKDHEQIISNFEKISENYQLFVHLQRMYGTYFYQQSVEYNSEEKPLIKDDKDPKIQ